MIGANSKRLLHSREPSAKHEISAVAHIVPVPQERRITDYAYVIACAPNQRAPILTFDRGLIERARGLKLDVLEVNVS